MNTLPTPSTEADAQQRAFRTLVQGLGFDVLTGTTVALTAAVFGGIEWTQAYWVALGLAVAKSAVVAAVSYLARKYVPPLKAPTGEGGGAL
jgi:hypothetical protein